MTFIIQFSAHKEIHHHNKTLGRAQDPFFLGQTIDQKARRDGREARGSEEKEKRGLRKTLKDIWKGGTERPPFIRIF